jgi:hypothetical protein
MNTTSKLATLFILVVLFGSTLNAQEGSKPFTIVDSLGDQNAEAVSFEFSVNKYRYRIEPDGRGRRIDRESPRSFSLGLNRHDYLTGALYCLEYEGDLILIGEVTDCCYGSGFIARLDGRTFKRKWKRVFSAFNVGPGLLDGTYAYVTGIGFVGKVSLQNGSFVWRHQDLYQRNNSAFNSFEVPEVNGGVVVFRESSHYLREKKAAIRVERKRGKILSVKT